MEFSQVRRIRASNRQREVISCLKWTNDGKYAMGAGSESRELYLWNPHRDDPLNTGWAFLVKSYSGGHARTIKSLAVSEDNGRIISGGEDRSLFLWEVSTGRIIRRISAHQQAVNCVIFNADATLFFAASDDRTISAWDLRSNSRQPVQLFRDFKDAVTSVALSPAGSALCAGSVDCHLRTFDIRNGQMWKDNLCDPVTCVNVSSDGRAVLSSCMGSSSSSSSSNSNNSNSSSSSGSSSSSSSRESDGNSTGGGNSGAAYLTDFASGVLLQEFRGHAHSHYSIGSGFSGSDRVVISGSEDGAVVAWDKLAAGPPIARARPHDSCLTALACHPTQELVLSAAVDGSACLQELIQCNQVQ
jgi:mitogen-activated protein kinase organizer 1